MTASVARKRWAVGIAVAAMAMVSAGACGRRGAVRAPEDIKPATITDLSAKSTTEGVQLTWSRPEQYVDGTRMLDLGGFEIHRGVDDTELPPLAVVDVTDRERFQQARRFRYLDREIVAGQSYQYRVVSFTLDGYFSAPSNVAMISVTNDSPQANAPLPTPQR